MDAQLKQYIARGAAVFAMLAAAVGTGFGLYYMLNSAGSAAMPSIVRLPLLTITGVLALLVALALISAAFALLELSDKNQALGLPEGSIRAVIAIGLLLIFSILTIFLYSDLAAPPTKDLSSISNLTPAQAKALGSTVKVLYEKTEADEKGGITVYFREPRSAAAEDFAKQLLVLIGTLLTSVTSFYFGSKAAATNTTDAAPAKPVPKLTSVTPNPLARAAPAQITISGSDLERVNDVKLVQGGTQVTATAVTWIAGTLKCDFSLNAGAHPAGAWDVVATDSNGRQGKLSAGLTLT